MSDEEVLRQLFQATRDDVVDDGFTRGVMQRVERAATAQTPSARKRRGGRCGGIGTGVVASSTNARGRRAVGTSRKPFRLST